MNEQLTADGILSLNAAIKPTTFIQSERLNGLLNARIIIATETFQRTGSFKFRAAYNVCSTVPERTLITASSGNFGQALACAASMLDKQAIVVMPDNSAAVKVAATRSYGATVDLINTQLISRADRVAELSKKFPAARVCSAYDDPLVIAGNATLGAEIAALPDPIDAVFVPVGGGGLSAGIVSGMKAAGRTEVKVIGAEPRLANDASRSFRGGAIVRMESEPQTLADGARTVSLGKHNWDVLRSGLSDVWEVSEELIIEALRRYFFDVNLKVEPTGALALGALLEHRAQVAGKTIVVIVSGGNVDPDLYCRLIVDPQI